MFSKMQYFDQVEMRPFFEKNYREILLNLFIITIVGGSFMLEHKIGGVSFYAFRDFLILGLVFLFITKKIKLYSNRVTKMTFFLLIAWLLYAIISLSWCLDRVSGFKDIMYLLWGISTFIFLVSLKHGYKEFENKLIKNWSYVFVIVLIFAIWEVTTGNHLMCNFSERSAKIDYYQQLKFIPIFTFDNPNHFAIYACFSSALFIKGIINKRAVLIFPFLLMFCFWIIHIEKARLGFITISGFGVIIGIYYLTIEKMKNVMPAIITVGGLIFIFSLLLIGVFGTNELILDSKNSQLVAQQHKVEANNSNLYDKLFQKIQTNDNSVFVRKNLILNGIDFFIQSNGMGVGAGNYKTYIQKGKGKYETGTVISPHNWFIEILSQYGVIIISLFLVWGFYIFKIIFQSIKSNGIGQKHILPVLLLTCYVVMSNANSSFISLPLNWLMFSLIALFADELLENDTMKNV